MNSPNQQPTKDWLDFCVTTRARARIRSHIRAELRQKSVNLGRELLEAEMRGAGLSFTKLSKNDDEIKRVAARHGAEHLDDLLLDIGYGRLHAEEVVQGMQEQTPDSEPPSEQLRTGRIEQFVRRVTGRDQAGIRVSGIDDVLVRYARCCSPLPGDAIIGFITRGRGVTVHRRECRKALDMDPERRIEVSWDSKAKVQRPVQICVTTTNKPGILATVSQTFSAQSINISEANCRADDDGHARNVFTFNCSDVSQLKTVIKALQKVSGVVDVSRI
jgi:GTP pyrophosphokinase